LLIRFLQEIDRFLVYDYFVSSTLDDTKTDAGCRSIPLDSFGILRRVWIQRGSSLVRGDGAALNPRCLSDVLYSVRDPALLEKIAATRMEKMRVHVGAFTFLAVASIEVEGHATLYSRCTPLHARS
jgi:hypothetical protein